MEESSEKRRESLQTAGMESLLTAEQPLLSYSSSPPRFGEMANCYVFKSRLQEYAQKINIPTPVYQTVKDGPSHEPVFKSTVIVNDVTYESLPGFFNRKAAEQSAAEIALMEIHKSGQKTECIPQVHETGLCKNLLQEYAQRMNYAIPSYICNKQQSGADPFSCTVEIGGIQYIGAAAKTKKEAEIKAARTALLAIQYGSESGTNGAKRYTVLPGKKKGKEHETQPKPVQQLKPKKANLKKKWPRKRKFPRKKTERNKDDASIDSCRGKDEPGSSGGMDAEPLNQNNELKMSSAMEFEGSYEGELHDRSTMLRAERFEEFQEREILDSMVREMAGANGGEFDVPI